MVSAAVFSCILITSQKRMFFSSNVNPLISVLGTPGNTLVMILYVQKITTSISVYVFALVVFDLTTFFSGIVLTGVSIDNMALVLVFFAGDVAIILSTFFQAFVAIKHLMVVRRLYAFKSVRYGPNKFWFWFSSRWWMLCVQWR